MIRYQIVCEECGGMDLEFEAGGWWDFDSQEMQFDWNGTYCRDCQDEVNTCRKRIPFLPLEINII